MKVFLALALFCLAVSATPVQQHTRYDGYQVFRVHSSSEEDLQYLNFLESTSPALDFWKEATVYNPADIMVSPEQAEELRAKLDKRGMKYEIAIPNVQKNLDKTLSRLASKAADSGMDWTDYHDVDTFYAWYDELAATYPDLVSVETIGTSYEGRELRLVKVSSNRTGTSTGNKPAFFIDSLIHAREWITGATVSYMLNELVVNYTLNADIVDNLDWYFLCIYNVDGYDYTWTTNRYWRKTRSHYSENNNLCYGVDANRNYDYDWEGAGSSENCLSGSYAGPEAFSEVEVQAQSNFIYANKDTIKAYINFHSYGQLWMTPWGYTTDLPPDYDVEYNLAVSATDALTAVHGKEYTVGSIANVIYLASGSTVDWIYGTAGVVYSYGVELRDKGLYGFDLPAEEIIPSGQETFAAIRVIAEQMVELYS